MTLRKFILLCLLLVSAKDLRAQDPRIQTRDSLRGCLATLPHDILRLQTYQKLILATQNNPDEYRQYNEELLAEAKLQKNDNYMCQAYLAQIIIAYNIYDGEKVHDLFAKMEPVARRSGNYNLLFRAWHCAIDVLLLEQDYQKNEREGLRMLQEAEKLNNPFGISEAYQALATLYKNTFRHAEAAELLEKALPLAIAQGQFNPVTNIRQSLLFIYHETQDFENWNRTLQEFEAYMQQQNAADPYMRQLTLVILYSSYLEYCNSTEDYVRGEHYLNLVEKYIQGIDAPLYEINFNSIAASYYRKTEQYEKALAKIDNALGNIRQGLVNDTDYHDFLAQKADMLHKMHRTKEALPLYKAVRKYRDSMQVVTIDKQYAQLKKDYKADTFLLEQATLQSRIRIFTIGLLIVALLTIVYFMVYLLRSHRFLQRAEQETQEMTKRMRLANEAKERFLSNINNMIRRPLNTVVEGSLRLSGAEVEDPVERQALSANIRRMSANLLQLINDILDLSRLEAGMMKFAPTDIEITAMLQDAVRASDNNPENAEIRLVQDYQTGTLFMTSLDGNRLLEVFTSLCARTAPGCDRIILTIHGQQAGVVLQIMGSALAKPNPSQEVIIRNEINRMLIEHFGGTYEVNASVTPPTITITLPTEVIVASEGGGIKG